MPQGTDREGDRHQGYSRDEYSDTHLHFRHTVATVESTVFHHRPLRLPLCCALWPRRCYGPTPGKKTSLLKSERSGGQSGRERCENSHPQGSLQGGTCRHGRFSSTITFCPCSTSHCTNGFPQKVTFFSP